MDSALNHALLLYLVVYVIQNFILSDIYLLHMFQKNCIDRQ